MGKQTAGTAKGRSAAAERAPGTSQAALPHAKELEALLGDSRNPLWIAMTIHAYPIYEVEFVQYLQAHHGNAFASEVLGYLDVIQDNAVPAEDHTASRSDRGALASGAQARNDRRAPAPGERLPYDGRGGWNAVEINAALGQFDQIAGTDSDGERCAFATALAGQIFQGPAAVARWVDAFKQVGGTAQAVGFTAREKAARGVMDAVCEAIVLGTATYGDLSWLQEALHSYTVRSDTGGTGSSLDATAYPTETFESRDLACAEPATLLTAARELPKGSRYLLEWEATAAAGGGRIRHQMMVANDQGTVYLYDSDIQADGAHLRPLTKRALAPYFDPSRWQASVIKVAGMVTPRAPAAR